MNHPRSASFGVDSRTLVVSGWSWLLQALVSGFERIVARDLLAWYDITGYKSPSDYLWATNASRAGPQRGKPVRLSTVMRDHIQPTARKLRIHEEDLVAYVFGRFSSVLNANGEDVKVVQELLHHSTIRMTMDTYTEALSPHKRAAQSKVVSMIRPTGTCTVVVLRTSEEVRVSV